MATLASGKLSEQFEDFLKSVLDRSGNAVYRGKISQLIATEGKSLVVDFGDLLRYNNDLANRLLLEPDSSLASFKIAAFETMRSENALYADRVKRELTVRLRGLPDLVPLRRVDTSYIDHMLAISGMVVRTSELRPMMTEAAWVCPSGHLTYQGQDDLILKRPPKCELCGEAKSFELDKKRCRFVDFQVLRVQELPEELPPGQLPQFFDVNVEGDIVNMARPGDRVVLTGVVRAVPDYTLGQVRTRLFRSQVDCNQVEVKGKEPDQVVVSKEDEELIRKIASVPDAYERLINSIAPVILGHQQEKEAILLLLAGGSATLLPDGTKLRGDINALFVGDPGTGKSELLKFASQVAPRGLYASGRGTTAAGLSAAVIREKNVLMLEAGVVVLADLGIAAIDEFEKMKPDDRTALHEMMEQQTVTIAKGGIYATLNARTAILAACNPVLGRYNPFQNLIENIGTLPIPLLTRFDIIFVFRDQPSPADDERLASHILSVHARRSYSTPPPIEFSLLKKYLTFAKKISPTLTKAAMDRIREFYLELRKSSGAEDSIPPTLRTLEALIRISTARARVLLRDEVTEEDALSAIALMNRMVEDILTDAATKKTDFGIQLGKPAGETKNLRSALEVLKSLEGPEKKPVERKLFKEELVKAKFTDEDAEKMIRTMFREGMVYESKPGFIRRLGS
ncbi:MAG: minichromosome maintenance protein MCM [Nitrososphaerota archaeon]|jgi:replicative DNA helicase Mcm|nr:minichromosome maintenance protein MCM [Nitrososphaerota archaeon]MDG6955834.1 minichromosome maintenance protein MCM [Nitrososphaerota archaeon]MDG6957460.1 minichromosome maintenance protein MCM [Nitrososphaerota archaeon]MDG6959217.1 minichromosome maintenance protein MCM [Nitrososphaerota archaeon]MDG6968744.1 minichromosome maintenance protein MCM [Nitrososphaerota archaeon]